MAHRKSVRIRVVATWLSLLVSCLMSTGAAAAQDLATLLKPGDLERLGLKGLAPDSEDPQVRSEQMALMRGSDSSMVVSLARIGGAGSGTGLRTALEIVSKNVKPVSGVGDEAYVILGGWGLAFRKGGTTLQLMTGADPSGAKPFLTEEQLVQLAKVVTSRL